MNSEKIKRTKRALCLTAVALLLVFIDQLTKAIAQHMLVAPGNIPKDIVLIPNGWLWLTYSENSGAAFSSFSGGGTMMRIITYLTPVLVAAFIVLAFTVFKKNVPAQAALFVVSAGAVGNFIDRVAFRGILPGTAGQAVVRDFVGLKFFNICNFADFCITLGAVALIVILFFIGPGAAFPLKKSWREEQRRQEEEKKRKNGEA